MNEIKLEVTQLKYLSVSNMQVILKTRDIITYRVCGRGNVFVLSVCLSVRAITFEPVDIETSFLV